MTTFHRSIISNIENYFLAHGVYQFEAYMMGYTSTQNHFFIMRKNGAEICRGFVNDIYPYSTGYCVTTIEMQVGDQVYIEGTGDFRGHNYCGFSGFQIKAL